jgi:hypothetical protein
VLVARDGCDVGLARCQPGYYCNIGKMIICPPGKWRDLSYGHVHACYLCERVGVQGRQGGTLCLQVNDGRVACWCQGRFRAMTGGISMESCSKCPQGKYVNTTGTVSDAKCNRCPEGKYGPEPGKCCFARNKGLVLCGTRL